MTEATERTEKPRVNAADIGKILEKERGAKIAATARADNLERGLNEERSGRIAAEKAAVNNALVADNATLETLYSQYEEAMNNGEHRKAAEINGQIAAASVRVEGWKQRQTQIEQFEKAPPTQTDPVRQWVSALPVNSRAWCESHVDDLRDPEFRNAVAYAASAAEKKGHKVDSPEYIDFIEGKLRNEGLITAGVKNQRLADDPAGDDFDDGFDDDFDDGGSGDATQDSYTAAIENVNRDADARPTRQKPQTAAPSRRQPPNGQQRQSNGRQMRLEAEEVEMALKGRDLPGNEARTDEELIREYADNKAALLREGKIQRRQA